MSRQLFEAMESRTMMSVTLNAATHVLTATGTNNSDQIVVADAGTNVKVTVNGAASWFPKAKVAKIVLNGLGGADSLRSNNTVKIPTTINGGDGADYLQGGAGDDKLYGQNGDDVMDGGYGADYMSGGAGRDTIDYSSRTENLQIEMTSVADPLNGSFLHDIRVIDPNNGNAIGDEIDQTTTEDVRGGSGNDVIYGSELNNTIWGNGGNDTIVGNGGNDTINGGTGDDNLFGGFGNDTISGDAGKDKMYGEGGNDFIAARDQTYFEIVDGGSGYDQAKIDSLQVHLNGSIFWAKDAASGIEMFL